MSNNWCDLCLRAITAVQLVEEAYILLKLKCCWLDFFIILMYKFARRHEASFSGRPVKSFSDCPSFSDLWIGTQVL